MNILWILPAIWKKKKKETDKGFTLKRRTWRGLAAGRHWAGPAARPHARRGHVGGGFLQARLHLPAWPGGWATDERGPPAGPSPTSRATRRETEGARPSGADALPGDSRLSPATLGIPTDSGGRAAPIHGSHAGWGGPRQRRPWRRRAALGADERDAMGTGAEEIRSGKDPMACCASPGGQRRGGEALVRRSRVDADGDHGSHGGGRRARGVEVSCLGDCWGRWRAGRSCRRAWEGL